MGVTRYPNRRRWDFSLPASRPAGSAGDARNLIEEPGSLGGGTGVSRGRRGGGCVFRCCNSRLLKIISLKY
jgi:hypothetical protein